MMSCQTIPVSRQTVPVVVGGGAKFNFLCQKTNNITEQRHDCSNKAFSFVFLGHGLNIK